MARMTKEEKKQAMSGMTPTQRKIFKFEQDIKNLGETMAKRGKLSPEQDLKYRTAIYNLDNLKLLSKIKEDKKAKKEERQKAGVTGRGSSAHVYKLFSNIVYIFTLNNTKSTNKIDLKPALNVTFNIDYVKLPSDRELLIKLLKENNFQHNLNGDILFVEYNEKTDEIQEKIKGKKKKKNEE